MDLQFAKAIPASFWVCFGRLFFVFKSAIFLSNVCTKFFSSMLSTPIFIERTAKEGLLLWCQRKLTGLHDINVRDFTNSWKDGLALCGLIYKHQPALIPFDTLNKVFTSLRHEPDF